MKNLTKRQKAVFDFIRIRDKSFNQEIAAGIEDDFGKVDRSTIQRDLKDLVEFGLIERGGVGGQDVWYKEKIVHLGFRSFDVEKYFSVPIDERKLISETFNDDVFDYLKPVFTPDELQKLVALNNEYRENKSKQDPELVRREYERIAIEFSWKSARIEGNTYSLIDTEILIKNNEQAKGHNREEAYEILNHKEAIDYAINKKSDFKDITLPKIENIHSILVKRLNISTGIREGGVGIIGTRYSPLKFSQQIREKMEQLVALINQTKDPFSKAFIAIIMLSYIQPFKDGNKRTARLIGNAILLAHDAAPLSYRSANEADYKRGMILFYEQNSFRHFKEMFIEQFIFAAENYFV